MRASLIVLLALFGVAGCTLPSRQEVETAQAFNDISASLQDIRLVQQELADQFDSLRAVVARQDSTIRTLANLAGVAVPPR